MNIIKNSLIENLIDASLNKLGEISIKITESSTEACCSFGGLYETTFPQELLELEK